MHKTQSLSILHQVLGCLEGVFAQGHGYVMVSRVTDPANFALCGLPPKDLVDDVAAALRKNGYGMGIVACLATTPLPTKSERGGVAST